jgi:hypothetical protein
MEFALGGVGAGLAKGLLEAAAGAPEEGADDAAADVSVIGGGTGAAVGWMGACGGVIEEPPPALRPWVNPRERSAAAPAGVDGVATGAAGPLGAPVDGTDGGMPVEKPPTWPSAELKPPPDIPLAGDMPPDEAGAIEGCCARAVPSG